MASVAGLDGIIFPALRQYFSVGSNIQMTQSSKQFKLDKRIWTEADFDNMQWHDNPIHAITFYDNFELLMDIDYVYNKTLYL